MAVTMTMPAPIIAAGGVEKVYDTGAARVQALDGVDLRVAAGEIVVIMGPSGCGKTTLLGATSEQHVTFGPVAAAPARLSMAA